MVKFQDLNTYQTTNCYVLTNENTSAYRNLLKNIPDISRAAAICAGGEVGFFCLLPKVTDELVLVDHGYQAVGVAMVKHYLLKKHGAIKVREFLCGSGDKKDKYSFPHTVSEEFKKELKEALKSLPKVLQEVNIGNLINKAFVNYTGHISTSLSREWSKYTPEILAGINGKLDLVSFVHGDFGDLGRRRPFDLIYISNMLGHINRHNAHPKIESIQKLVKRPGGFILRSDAPGMDEKEAWMVLETLPRDYTSWTHGLYSVKEAAKEAITV